MDIFDAKVRQVGTSFGILIPKEAKNKFKLQKGETLQIAILKKDELLIEKMCGSAKGKPFKRDHNDRVM